MQRTSLMEQALAVLRQAMVTGEIRTGEIYSAAALASRLGVSNSPVREAMLTLVSEGLMEPVRNRGFKVVPVTFDDVRHIHDIRMLLEVPAMREVARRHSEFDVARFRAVADAIVNAAAEGDVNGYLQHDRAFHLGLTDLLGNRRMTTIIGNLRDQTRLFGLHGLSDAGQLVSSAAEHVDIIEALVAGDESSTDKLMRKHLGHIVREWAGDIRADSVDER